MEVILDPTALLETVPGSGKRLFRLARRFNFIIDGAYGYADEGFITDLASTPLGIDNDEPYILRAAILHDLYCQHAGSPPNCPTLTRAQTNRAFREAMRFCGASFSRRWIAWIGVTAWTFFNWHPEIVANRRTSLRVSMKQAAITHETETRKTPGNG